jgi:hypothetical protein
MTEADLPGPPNAEGDGKMVEGIAASFASTQLQGASRPGGQVQPNAAQASGSPQTGRPDANTAAAGVGASDAAPDQAVGQSPRAASPGPENDFGRRGTLIDIAA